MRSDSVSGLTKSVQLACLGLGYLLAGQGGAMGEDSPKEKSKLELLRTLEGHEGAVTCTALSRDGKLLASGARDGLVRIWEIGSGKLLFSLKEKPGYPREITFLACEPTTHRRAFSDSAS
jgi:WD40 repeat protein